MKRSSEILSSVAAVLFHVALGGWLFCLSVISFDFEGMGLNFLLLSLAAVAAYGINCFLLKRGVPAPLYVVVQAVMTAAGAWLFVKTLYLEPFVLRTAVISCVIYCFVFPSTAYIAYFGVGKNGMLLRFDLLAVLMILLLLLSYFKDMPAFSSTLTMCALALAVTILAQISERAGRFSSGGSKVQGSAVGARVLLGAAFAFVLLLTGVITLLAFSGVESVSRFFAQVLTAAANGVKSALVFLYRQLERFMVWLASMMDDAPMEAAGVGMGAGGAAPIDYGEGELELPAWLAYAAAAVGAALFAWVLFRLRRSGLKKTGGRRLLRRVSAKRENGLSPALAGLFAAMGERLRYRIDCVRYRRTAPGLLVYCEKKAGKEQSRREGESGEEFLLRLARRREGEDASTLRSLAEAVERTFYSPRPAPVSRELYAAVKKLKFT